MANEKIDAIGVGISKNAYSSSSIKASPQELEAKKEKEKQQLAYMNIFTAPRPDGSNSQQASAFTAKGETYTALC